MSTSTKQTPKITDPETILLEIHDRPAAELRALHAFLADCERRKADPDPATSIRGEIEADRAMHRIDSFNAWPIESRARQLADNWIAENADEIVALKRENLAERTHSKAGFLASVGKKVSAISLEMFAPDRDRAQLAADREKAEEDAAAVEADIQTATHEIRRLELEPSLESYRRADAAIKRIQYPNFPQPVSGN